jgi:outer membrane protein assembly factor BamB
MIFLKQIKAMRISHLLCILLMIIFGCKKDDNAENIVITNNMGEIKYLPPLWGKSYIENQNWLNAPPSIFGNWSFNDRVLLNFRKNDNTISLQCLKPENGELCWEWNDWFNPLTEQTNGSSVLLKDNILHWKTGTRQYWINIDNGSTIKKNDGDQVFSKNMTFYGDTYFCNGVNYDSFPNLRIKCIYQGDFYEVSPEMVLMPTVDLSQTLNDRAADVSSVIPYVDGNDTVLIVAWQQVFPNWDFQSYLGNYNLSQKERIYDNVPLCEINRKGVLYQPIKRHNNTVITNVGESLICYDFLTGEKVWENEFGHDFSFSGFEISENVLVANCEDKNLYGIDPQTGQILWTGEGAGTSSLLQDRIMDGVVYFNGGSSGYFHAVDIHTGKTLWKLDPYLYEDSNAYWSGGDVHVVKPSSSEKGYVIINNALNTYCFEAAK